MKKVNTFVDMDTELVKESSKKAKAEIAQESISKRVGEALEQEISKKQKVDDDKETKELKQCMKIISDDGDDVTMEATPLSTKSPTIVDYKIYKEGKKSYFKIIRANGNSQMYLTFGKMLKNFGKEDLEVIWSIFKTRFKKTKPVNYMDIFLHLNLKTMFEHHLEDSVWKNQQGLVKVMNWKLYDSCGVHCLTMHNILYYMLVEKMYLLTKYTLHQMFNDVKLQVDYECEMALELLRLVKKQLKEGYDRNLLDHRSILMRELSIDYGPTPFRFFHSWFNLDGFDKMVEDTWKSLATIDSNGMINLKKKLQALKIFIKQWTKNAKKSSYKAKISIQSKLSDIDKILDQCDKGDENTKSFHGSLNSKHSQLAIRETLVDGEWIVDPLAVKSVFLNYFSTQLSSPISPRICFVDQFTNRLSLEQQADLERNISNE
ncbi:hypothetical protein Tco_1048336, partial [Tanacetum coccineum]